MSKKKWFVLILVLLGITGWYFLFYKTYSKTSIPKTADMVFSIDVKRNTNTILAYYVTTPAEWNFGSIFKSSKKKKGSWQSAVKIPDYIFLFHCTQQPASAFYCLLDITNEDKFNEALIENGFIKGSSPNQFIEYSSKKLGIDIIRNGDQLLIGNIAVKDKSFIRATASELFQKKEYMSADNLKKIIAPANHFSIWVDNNDLFQQPVIFNGNFKNGSLSINASIKPTNKDLTENLFIYNDQSIANLGFIQPSTQLYHLIDDSVRSKISTALNFNIDSLFLRDNKNYTLDIAEIKNKVDSAISYTYDDDFNKIETVVVNNIQEPSFSFKVNGRDCDNLFNYWKKNKNMEVNDNGNLFISVPFVKSYAYNTKDSLILNSYNYTEQKTNGQMNCIGHLSVNPTKIPGNLFNYLPDNFSKLVAKIELLNIVAKKNNETIDLNISLDNKVKNKPFLLSFN